MGDADFRYGDTMSKDFIFSMARHMLTLAGGYLVAHGFADAGTVETLVGGVMAAAAVAWSYWHHAPNDPPAQG